MATKQMKKNELEFEDFDPVYEMKELPEKFIVCVRIPGFRKEDFKVQVDTSGKLRVKGQQNKCKRFNKVVQLPPDSDIEKIRGTFEGDVLTLTVSRKEKMIVSCKERIIQEQKDRSVLEVVDRNRKEIAVAVAAFSIGFIVAHKLSSRK